MGDSHGKEVRPKNSWNSGKKTSAEETLTKRPARADELNMDGDVPMHEDLVSTRLVLGGELAAGVLTVRYAREGDTIRPFGMTGRKALSDLFGECRIPRLRRARLPVIEAGGEIVWVAGVRASESSRLPPDADRGCVLELER